jgi:hypothetical protein
MQMQTARAGRRRYNKPPTMMQGTFCTYRPQQKLLVWIIHPQKSKHLVVVVESVRGNGREADAAAYGRDLNTRICIVLLDIFACPPSKSRQYCERLWRNLIPQQDATSTNDETVPCTPNL